MISTTDLRKHILTAADRLDLPLTVLQAGALANFAALEIVTGGDLGTRDAIHLTDCEHAALAGLAAGESAEETGRRLCRSEHTIKTHRRTLYAALGAKSGPHAVAIALGLGLLRATRYEQTGGAR
ncbi:helix-turn-helix transcriptional regulator [Streptomyces parvulus]|uniref:helix-turn-helix transcriptional regulator n=1 Tax=Streptomyces parvulus TaxID=146923 RepID=UPI0033CDE6AF